MKSLKFSLVLLAMVALLWSCKKEKAECVFTDSAVVATQAETDSLSRYILANSILNTVKHPAGFFYVINAAGTGNTPTICSTVEVTYAGFLFSGAKFDGTTGSSTATFPLGNLIVGWQKAIPLLRKGGSMRMYLPPSLAYGARAVGSIPANSYLIFDVGLVSIQ